MGSFEELIKLRDATKKSMATESLPRKELQVKKSGVAILAIILVGLISPFIILNLTVKGPPLVFPEKERHVLEDFCGAGVVNIVEDEREFNNLTKLGVHWVRTSFPWISIEWNNDQYDYSVYDDYVANCTKYNMKIIALLLCSPTWLNLSGWNYLPPKYIDHWLEFVNKTVRRYKDTVAAWDIWNEPETKRYWDGPIEDYYYLFGRTVNLIHDIDPNLYVMGPSLASAGSGWFPPNLEDMFKLGILQHLDAIDMHIYNYDPDMTYQAIKQYVTLGNKYGFKGDYVISEMGNPTQGAYPFVVSMEKLAENVIKNLVIASALQIKTCVWFCSRDLKAYETEYYLPDSELWFGLSYNNLTWKKGAHAFSLFSKFCSNSTYCPDLIIKEGGISATDLMASLYRQEDGTSTLIMWYAPTLYESGTVKVNLDLSAIGGSILIHDIYTGTNRTLDENFVVVGDAPIFLTFQPKQINDSITLQVQESILAVVLYISMIGMFIASISLVVVIRKPNKASKI
ncbi:MAG: beta-galactosidase [Candidatus Lokiarchaeota archaeon]|nr:beta-galactosidase [Candidatus Lokiarchaeota archaeon]